MRRGRPCKSTQAYRNPPMPLWFMTSARGTCRWCNKPIYNELGIVNYRRRWHKECLHPYFLITDHRYAKREVKKRDKAVCAICKTKCSLRSEWQLDHIKPLIDAKGDISFWQLQNLQTLCNNCHHKKTAKENAFRNKII